MPFSTSQNQGTYNGAPAVEWCTTVTLYVYKHGLWTPKEGINQRYLKNWADVANKICFGQNLKIWDWD